MFENFWDSTENDVRVKTRANAALDSTPDWSPQTEVKFFCRRSCLATRSAGGFLLELITQRINWTQNNTGLNVKPLKIQHLFHNPKKYSGTTKTQKNTVLPKFETPKNTPLIPVNIYAKSTPWELKPGSHKS